MNTTTKPTSEEEQVLYEAATDTSGVIANVVLRAWQVGYLARQKREKEHFSSAHGQRTITAIRALLAIVRPNGSQEIAVVQAATDLLGVLESGGDM
jgi:hypothetical protein